MEQVSFRVHVRAVAFASKAPRPVRRLLEVAVLLLALAIWALIAGLHATYIQVCVFVCVCVYMYVLKCVYLCVCQTRF